MTEKKRDYDEFAKAVQDVTKPNNIIDFIYTRDFALNQWERERYRRFEAKFFELKRKAMVDRDRVVRAIAPGRRT